MNFSINSFSQASIFTFSSSVRSGAKLPVILNELQKGSQSPATFYKKLNKKFVSVAEFSSALDCLYALGAIELLDEGVIQYVS
ncbi:ABC-three component system middle component 7 [Enterococcus faecium]|uniref:ABC-three component system middle component 7 n=1 Tax=Enterococcus faecium TaxID=1352 RepID=UPI003D127747